MNPFTADQKKHAIILLLRSLPKSVSENQLADFFWQRLGINIPSENLSIRPLADSANCLCIISRASLSDFFARALEHETIDGQKIQVAQPKQNDGRESER